MSSKKWYQSIIDEIASMQFSEPDMYLRSGLCLYCLQNWNKTHACPPSVQYTPEIENMAKRIISYRSKASHGLHSLHRIAADLNELYCQSVMEKFPTIVQENAPKAYKKLFAVCKERFHRDVLFEEANVIMILKESESTTKGCWFCFDLTHSTKCPEYNQIDRSPHVKEILKYGRRIVENMNEKVFWRTNTKLVKEYRDDKVVNVQDASRSKRIAMINEACRWMMQLANNCS